MSDSLVSSKTARLGYGALTLIVISTSIFLTILTIAINAAIYVVQEHEFDVARFLSLFQINVSLLRIIVEYGIVAPIVETVIIFLIFIFAEKIISNKSYMAVIYIISIGILSYFWHGGSVYNISQSIIFMCFGAMILILKDKMANSKILSSVFATHALVNIELYFGVQLTALMIR